MKPIIRTMLLSAAVTMISTSVLPQSASAEDYRDRTQSQEIQMEGNPLDRMMPGRDAAQRERERVRAQQVQAERERAEEMRRLAPAAGEAAPVHIINLSRADTQHIQRALRDRGYYRAAIDGLWGPQTANAMRQYENDRNLAVTGRGNLAALDQLGFVVAGIDWEPVQRMAKQQRAERVERIEPAAGMPHQVLNLSRNDVRTIQQSLRDHGYYRAAIDGVWGRRTSEAMRQFERDNGLTVTGSSNKNALEHLGLDITAMGAPMERRTLRPMQTR